VAVPGQPRLSAGACVCRRGMKYLQQYSNAQDCCAPLWSVSQWAYLGSHIWALEHVLADGMGSSSSTVQYCCDLRYCGVYLGRHTWGSHIWALEHVLADEVDGRLTHRDGGVQEALLDAP